MKIKIVFFLAALGFGTMATAQSHTKKMDAKSTVMVGGEAMYSTKDIFQSNGVIHSIDTVVLPK